MRKLTEARRSLENAKESALARLQQIDEERRDIKASIRSLDSALKALTKSGSGASDSSPKVTMAELTDLAAQIVSTGTKTRIELLKALGSTLAAQGKSRAGLAGKLDVLLSEGRFHINGEGGVVDRSQAEPTSRN
jgi:flagellar hook-length control protein FliK